ncbi:MAG: ADP-forming succinate--CoA ligase subunit beta [Armatimonadetes bacterium]|nr:ADP-forming succinate--CoA ligase subunit beta [Armatimonadota bacterium]
MKIHEYQAKELLRKYNVPTPRGEVAETPEQVREIAERFGGVVAVKAQVHIGGRGKAGGIKVAKNPEEAEEKARQILGMDIKGFTVNKVLVEEGIDIKEEYYLGVIVDREAGRNAVMVSSAGGMDIEEVAAETPEKIAKAWAYPGRGLLPFQINRLIFDAGINPAVRKEAAQFLRALFDCYLGVDATLAEINPLVVTGDGKVIAADAKIDIDDNAMFRHPDLEAYRDEEGAENPLDAEARRRGINYVHLGGEVGIIGNGAGLVMATLDEVKRAGGNAANFLDIGGGAQADLVANSLDLVLSDPNVKGVVFNIFGGITRGDEVAKGILEGVGRLDVKVPIVVRLTGTNEEEGRAILRGSQVIPAETMQEAAREIVRRSRE